MIVSGRLNHTVNFLLKSNCSDSKWGNNHGGVEIEVIVSEKCFSVGDALREIDARSLIVGDFVLVNGDMVSNANLAQLIQSHKY